MEDPRGESVARDFVVVGTRGGPDPRRGSVHTDSPLGVGDSGTRGVQPKQERVCTLQPHTRKKETDTDTTQTTDTQRANTHTHH